MRRDVAFLDCALIELAEEALKDVIDADACQKVALPNVVVQRLWDVSFVAGGIQISRQTVN